MSKFYQIMNNPFFTFIGKLLDVIVLHLLWILCSLPIVTFGASTTALYYACMKDAEDKEGHYFRKFFHSFRINLKQGSILGLFFLLIEGALVYTVYICTANASLNPSFGVFRILAIIMAVIVLMVFEYAFPLLARFDNTLRATMKNAILLMVKNFGWTIVMTVVIIGFYVLMYYFERYIFPLMLLGFGLVVFICAFVLNHIFAPYLEEDEKKKEEEREKAREEEAKEQAKAEKMNAEVPEKEE